MTTFDPHAEARPGFERDLASGGIQVLPIVLLLDTSGSMQGVPSMSTTPIKELNQALAAWEREVKEIEQVRQQGEIALVTFGNGVRVVSAPSDDASTAFVRARDFRAPTLAAGGITAMEAAVRLGIRLATDRRAYLKRQGVMTYRPHVFLMSDGLPTDDDGNRSTTWHELVPELRAAERARRLLFFALGVAGADVEMLRALAPNAYYKADGISFGRLFKLVSASLDSMTRGGRDDPQRFKQIRELLA